MQVKVCQLCGKLAPITHTCKQCKLQVCESCFKHGVDVCSECYSRLKVEMPLLTFPLKLFLLGFTLMLVGMIFLIVHSVIYSNAQLSIGAIVIIGPLPIILGAGPYSFFVILLAAILTVLAIVFFLSLRR